MSDSTPDRSTLALELRGITKRYRLYQKPLYRFLDLFGLCPADAAHYSEHVAVNAIDLSIGRGEKVAIIGRNGAGKSTLLKIITGIVRPSAGDVAVHGRVSNLLQIGSGFHPDFTGRQNVFANLAHQGITGRDAERLFDEIADFSEIGEYIEQPMKTYSTGMCSRLMFSSSIVVKPDILIVDEILGVGDAYFSHKSFERMRQLCSNHGTTLLLVTHDIYSALTLCSRFIWLDRGAVMFDGNGKAAVSLYESSIKDQEEQLLRQKNAASIAANSAPDASIVHVLIRSRTGFAFPRPFAIESIELKLASGGVSAVTVAQGAPNWSLVAEGNLGPTQEIGGRLCRAIATHGSIFHKAEWTVALPPDDRILAATVRWNYSGHEPADFRIFTADRKVLVSGEFDRSTGWIDSTFDGRDAGSELDVAAQTGFGTGLVRITEVQFLGGDGSDAPTIHHGEPLTVRVGLQVEPLLHNRDIAFVLGFSRPGAPYSALVYDDRLKLPDTDAAEVYVEFDSVQLGSGLWFVNVGIGEPGLYEKPAMKYFSVDPSWYHVLASRLELQIASVSKLDASGCFVVCAATVRSLPATDTLRELDSTPSVQ